MSATSYLCVSGIGRLYPSARDPRFDPARQVICAGAGHVPLLWLALFRPGDLKRQSVRPIDGGPEDVVDALAPVASVDRALLQLDQAVPAIDALFGEAWGPIGPLAKKLAQAIKSAGQIYVTVELDEVEAGKDTIAYRDAMRRILRYFDAPDREGGGRELVEVLSQMCGIDAAALDVGAVAGHQHERKVTW